MNLFPKKKKKGEMHGLRKHPLYMVWSNIKTRCTNPNDPHYERWGGRGITICEKWRNSFKTFYDWALSHGYKDGLTIDRIDNDGNYEPSNCRFITVKEQNQNNQNKRNVILLTYEGKTMSIMAWEKYLGVGKNTVSTRYHKGWSTEECLFGKRVIK